MSILKNVVSIFPGGIYISIYVCMLNYIYLLMFYVRVFMFMSMSMHACLYAYIYVYIKWCISNIYIAAIGCADGNGGTPLHEICRGKCELEALKLMLSACPQGMPVFNC